MDKITQVIDMMEHPERYSEAQISELLQDEECRQTYLTMMEMRMAFDKEATDKNMDIDQEWQMFAVKHPHAKESSVEDDLQKNIESKKMVTVFSWRKIAASLVGVLMLSGIALAAIYTFSSHRQPEEVAVSDTTKVTTAPSDTASSSKGMTQVEQPVAKKEIIHKTFDNVTMEAMLGEMAKYYGVKVVFRNEEAKQLRFYYEWNSENSLQHVVDELNNSQQMNISLNDDELVVE